MRILVTNDDGIDSHGLHELARALVDLGDVTVVAPDAEYSGAGASLGAALIIVTGGSLLQGYIGLSLVSAGAFV